MTNAERLRAIADRIVPSARNDTERDAALGLLVGVSAGTIRRWRLAKTAPRGGTLKLIEHAERETLSTHHESSPDS